MGLVPPFSRLTNRVHRNRLSVGAFQGELSTLAALVFGEGRIQGHSDAKVLGRRLRRAQRSRLAGQ